MRGNQRDGEGVEQNTLSAPMRGNQRDGEGVEQNTLSAPVEELPGTEKALRRPPQPTPPAHTSAPATPPRRTLHKHRAAAHQERSAAA